jgi:hypothetical protein
MTDEFIPPFKPSWLDRFTDWLEALPGPYWLTILAIYLVLVVQSQVTAWISGIEVWGELNPEHLVYHLFSAQVLYFWKYLYRDAARALDAFGPLLRAREDSIVELGYRLKRQPARPVVALTILGAGVGVYYSYSVTIMNMGIYEVSIASLSGAIGFILPMTLALVLCYRIINQLRIVSRLYESASDIDLFNLEPVYALSTHTAKTGIFFLVIVYSNLLLSPGSIEIPTALLTTIVISLISLSAFVLPLRGINQRLVAEKKGMVAEVNNRIKKTFGLLESDFDNSQLDQMQKLGTTLSTLERQKTILESIPTWPWKPGIMRGFVSAMLLPIALWIIQQILEGILVF